jgi:hypothetical protein
MLESSTSIIEIGDGMWQRAYSYITADFKEQYTGIHLRKHTIYGDLSFRRNYKSEKPSSNHRILPTMKHITNVDNHLPLFFAAEWA